MEKQGKLLKISFLLLFSAIACQVHAQEKKAEEIKLKYYDHGSFIVEGTTFMDSVKENLYDRLPAS